MPLDFLEQHATGFDVADNRGALLPLEHLEREQQQELVRPADRSSRVDHPDAITITIEGDAEIGALGEYCFLQLAEVVRDGRSRMVHGEATIYGCVQQSVLSREALGESTDDRAHCAAAAIPHHTQRRGPCVQLSQPLDISAG